MSMILLAVEDAVRDAPVRDLLTAEGWWVTTVVSQEEAIRAAADHAPQLLIVDASLVAPGGLLSAFARQEGGPGVLVLVDREGDAAPEDSDGVLWRDQSPSEILAVVRSSLQAPRPASELGAAPSEVTSEDEQLTTSELFGDILQTLDGGGEQPSDGAPLVSEAAPEPEVEPEPEPEVEPDVEAPASEAEVEPEGELPEPEFALEPEFVGELEAPEIEQPVAAESQSAPEPEPEPEPEIEIEVLAPVVEGEQGLESAAIPASSVEEPDWLIERVLDEESPPEEAPDADLVVEPLPTEPSTDIEAAVDDLLAREDPSWRDPTQETGEIERLSIDQVLAADLPGADEGGVVEAEGEEPESDDEDLERLGPFELFEILEYGDLTERWLAARSDGARDKIVVERIRPELQSRADVRQAFVDGYSEAAGWDQKNLLKVVDLGRDGDVDYVATEYHAGHSLREVLNRVRRMEARMPLGIGLLLAERIVAGLQGLGAGPAPGRHGWLVPSSIWLTDDGEVLLREFGFGRLEPVDDVTARDWTEYRFVGPDFWSGQPDLRADLYSLGALLYETISGRPTHDADDPETLIEKIHEDVIAPAQVIDPTIPSEVEGWIMRLLRRNPGERPQALEEIAAKVDLALQSLPARPSNAELAAYLRQLFAARMPESSVKPAPSRVVPAPAATELDEGDASPWSVFAGRSWTWWVAVAALALVLAFFAWRLAAADEPEALSSPGSSPGSQLVPPAVPPPRGAGRPTQ